MNDLRETLRIARSLIAGKARAVGAISVLSCVGAGLEVFVLACLYSAVVAVMRGELGITVRATYFSDPIQMPLRWLLSLGLAGVVVRAGLDLVRTYLVAALVATFERERRDSLYMAFLNASHEKQSAERTGHLQTLITQCLDVARFALMAVCSGIGAVLTLVIFCVAACAIDPVALVCLVAMTGCIFVGLHPISQRSRGHNRSFATAALEFNNFLNQGIAASRELRVFNVVAPFRDRLVKESQLLRRYRRLTYLYASLIPVMYQHIALLMLFASLCAVFALGLGGVESSGVIALLLLRGYSYGQHLQSIYHSIVESSPYVSKLKDAEADYAAHATPDRGSDTPTIDRVELKEVSFTYPDGRKALTEVNFEIRRGEILAVVGESGSGKSTLTQLLLRLRVPSAGVIRVNGEGLERFSRATWYQRTAFVPQEPSFLDETVRESIRFLRPEVTNEAVESAAKGAGIYDEILAFPEGFETRIGERGAKLSGGQRQRICLARALAGAPDLLILDEPTSALDARSESQILSTLESCKGRLTVLIIGHRLAMLRVCDRMVVLQRGQVAAQGRPEEVAALNPMYREARESAHLTPGTT